MASGVRDRRSGLPAIVPDLWAISGTVVLHEGHAAGSYAPLMTGHRIFSYLDDFFGAPCSSTLGPSTVEETVRFGQVMKTLFPRLGLSFHPGKCDFSGNCGLEILATVVDTESAVCTTRKEVAQGRVGGQTPAEIRITAQTAIAGFRHPQVRRHRQLTHSHSGGRASVPMRALRRSQGTVCYQCHHPVRYLSGKADMTDVMSCTTCHGHVSARPLDGTRSHKQLRSVTRSLRVSHAGIRDLRWRACLSSNPYLGRELWLRPEAIVYTDASMSGWGPLGIA